MRRCFLHIGMNKTGSTAIQSAFQTLDTDTTAYLQLGHANHSPALVTLFHAGRADYHLNVRARVTPRQMEDRAARLRDALQDQLTGSRKTMVISGEGLSNTFGPEDAARMIDVLRPHFDEIRAIAYVREPVSYLRSAFQQVVKDNAASFDLARLYPDYARRLGPWEGCLGRDNMDYVLFDRTVFKGGDLLEDFAARIGVDWRPEPPETVNEALSAEVLAILYVYRKLRGSLIDNRFFENRNAEVVRRLRGFGHRRFDLAETVTAPIVAAKAEDIAWIEARLERTFPAPTRPEDAVVFGSEADILAFARICAEDFTGFAARELTPPSGDLAPLAETLDRFYTRS
jgi:hypothetical protein